jgi:hypothetical protein
MAAAEMSRAIASRVEQQERTYTASFIRYSSDIANQDQIFIIIINIYTIYIIIYNYIIYNIYIYIYHIYKYLLVRYFSIKNPDSTSSASLWVTWPHLVSCAGARSERPGSLMPLMFLFYEKSWKKMTYVCTFVYHILYIRYDIMYIYIYTFYMIL